MSKKCKKRKQEGIYTGEEGRMMDFLNSKLFEDIIDSFFYAFGRPPICDEFMNLKLFDLSNRHIFRFMYGSACEDAGYPLRSGTKKVYRVVNDEGFDSLMDNNELAEFFGMKQSVLLKYMRNNNEVQGYVINPYDGNIDDFWTDIYKKGYTKGELYAWAN